MINRTFSSIAVMIALGIFTPIQAYAFGLGKLELSSALNEPFRATIPVTALREDEQGNLLVRLATSSEFERAGLERNFFLTQLVFTVVEQSGATMIEVSSPQPIKEPFVDFLLTATTGEGRLIREYTVLLDPPKTMFVKPAKVITPVQTKAATSNSSTGNTTTYQYPDSNYQPSSVVNYFSGNSYGPTKQNDTLWEIAAKTKPSSSISIHQMMIAILDANPDAFINNNINNLKKGQTLTIPSSDEIARLPNSQAIARVAEQNKQWRNAANIATAQGSTDTMSSEGEDSQSPSSMPESGEDTARLQLVVADDTTAGNNDLSPSGSNALTQLRNQLTLAQETIEGQEQETIDFKARMDAMEEQLAIMRRIISVKDSDLARLQGMLGEDQQVELASDELVDEMEAMLEESQTDATAMDEVVEDVAEEILEEGDADTTMEEMVDVDSTEEMLEEGDADTIMDEMIDVDSAEETLVEDADTLVDEELAQAERMFDEAAVAAAAEAARSEAEFSGSNVFVEVITNTEIDKTDETGFDANNTVEEEAGTSINQDFLQEFRMLDEGAVAAAAKSARTEAGLEEVEVDTPIDEMSVEPDMDSAENMELETEAAVTEVPVMDDGSKIGLVDKIKTFIANNKMNALIGLGGLFVALLGWLFIRRRNQSDYEWVENDSLQNIDTSEVELAEDVVEESIETTQIEIENEAETEAVMADTLSIDLSDDTPQESIDDLLNQAEMSIAYGEYEQAHVAVEQARQQDPGNQAVALKLIALAYHQQQAEEFSKLAGEIDIDKESAAWLEITEWGRDLVPENALFSDAQSDDLSFNLDSSDLGESDVELEALVDSTEDSDGDELVEEDSSLDEAGDEDSTESLTEQLTSTDDEPLSFDTDFNLEGIADDEVLEFDTTLTLDSDDNDDEIVAETTSSDFDATVTLQSDSGDETVLEADSEDEPELILDSDSLENNLDEITSAEEPVESMVEDTVASEPEPAPAPEIADSKDSIEELDIGADDLDFDIGDFDEVDEAETKLDLAAAYVDMGDPDGAKNILDEVLKEGNDEQKSRAQDLLNNLT